MTVVFVETASAVECSFTKQINQKKIWILI